MMMSMMASPNVPSSIRAATAPLSNVGRAARPQVNATRVRAKARESPASPQREAVVDRREQTIMFRNEVYIMNIILRESEEAMTTSFLETLGLRRPLPLPIKRNDVKAPGVVSSS